MNAENLVKKLTGKNPKDFDFAASHLINNSDTEMFEALVSKSDFLFSFIKNNVSKRLSNAINDKNYKNLLSFFKIHSTDYENVIISALAKYADEEMTDLMLDLLEKGTDEEKTYAAKYFYFINDSCAIEFLRNYAYSDIDSLAFNSAQALSKMNDDFSYEIAIKKLESEDEFEKLASVRFLSAYGNKNALDSIFKTIKNSSMAENIAAEIPYLEKFSILLKNPQYKNDTIWALNQIINGLGEIISLSQIFDLELYEIFEELIFQNKSEQNSKIALLLVNSREKFETLTENDEYIFDEEKNVKEEVYEIKKLLNSQSQEFWEIQEDLFLDELKPNGEFIFTALEVTKQIGICEIEKFKSLLNSNQTVVLKTIEVIKFFGLLEEISKDEILQNISDENIKKIILSLFE